MIEELQSVSPAAVDAGPQHRRRFSTSVIIPTKNRVPDLIETVVSLLAQILLPDEVIVIDQTLAPEGRRAVEQLFADAGHEDVNLIYIHDPAIPGSAVARNVGIERATKEVVVFLDDDVILEPDFLKEMVAVYEGNPGIEAVSATVTNYTRPGTLHHGFIVGFYRGPFFDRRQRIYWNADLLRQGAPIEVRKFGAGGMSIRRGAIGDVRFDANLKGVPGGEDVDFCARLKCRFFITPRSRYVHKRSASNRTSRHWLEIEIRSAYYLFFRNWNGSLYNRLCFAWLNFGFALAAILCVLRARSLAPARGAWNGVCTGLRDGSNGRSAAAPAAVSRTAKTERVTVIIPTKNRPIDLEKAVESLRQQTVAPYQLIVVDQSADSESRRRVESQYAATAGDLSRVTKLCYVQDPKITGAATARNCAMEIAGGDVWLFLDDDVILEADFIERLLDAYGLYPAAAGVSGIVTNYPTQPAAYRWWNRIFMRGPYHDERQPIYHRADRLSNSPPIAVRFFGGGLMSFRASAIAGLRFDEGLKGVSDGEDIDFCTRVRAPKGSLIIAPRARLVHNQSEHGRLQDHWLRRHARASLFLTRKHWRHGLRNRLCTIWLLTGYGVVAAIASLRRGSPGPCRALWTGIQESKLAFDRERPRL